MVKGGSLNKVYPSDGLSFRMDKEYVNKPSGLAIEFCQGGKNYYYHIEYKDRRVILEDLFISQKSRDDIIFHRENGKTTLSAKYLTNVTNSFLDAVDRMVRPDMLLLSFFGEYYPKENEFAAEAYRWFTETLHIDLPDTITGTLPHQMDSSEAFRTMVNHTIPELNTGISSLEIEKVVVLEESLKGNDMMMRAFKEAQSHPGEPQVLLSDNRRDTVNLVYEEGQVWKKSLVAIHKMVDGSTFAVPMSIESDGMRRLLEYMPLFYSVIRSGGVYLADEIERSIHPIMIKEIVRKISTSMGSVGQLIFTTHESGLLDQKIIRPDEIWFAQKDCDQATRLYPLSDYNIHKTANIENGYLAGRYGAIPFLSNLKDLHW